MKIESSDKVIKQFPVLHQNWEMDSKGWIMEKENGIRYIKLTSHNSAYIADEQELNNRIDLYQKALDETKNAIHLLKNKY